MLAGWAITAIPFTVWWVATERFIGNGVIAFALGLPLAMTVGGVAAGVGGMFGETVGRKTQNRYLAAIVGGGVALIAGAFVMALLADKENWGCIVVVGGSSMTGGLFGGWTGFYPRTGRG
jgi:hypothetical protein